MVVYNVNMSKADTATAQSPKCSIHAGKLLGYINKERESLGAPKLRIDSVLASGARYKFDHMVKYKYFSHEMVRGEDWTKAIRDKGVHASLVENLGSNDLTPELSWKEFKNSPSHYGSLIDPQYERVGISAKCISYTIKHAATKGDKQYIGDKVSDVTVIMLAGKEPQQPRQVQSQQGAQPRYDYTRDLYETQTTHCETRDTSWSGPDYTTTCRTY